MTFFEAIFLGILQGLTEFFPVSSSAHLKIAKYFLSLGDIPLSFDLACHLGTTFAVAYFLRKEIREKFAHVNECILLFLAILPLIPVYFFLRGFLESVAHVNVGYFLLLTSFFLFFASKDLPSKDDSSLKRKIKDMLFIGLMQAAALIPGLSRSGSTIYAARVSGWTMMRSIQFSYLLAIPTILGGSVLEFYKLSQQKTSIFSTIGVAPLLVAFVVSFISGLISVKALFYLAKRKTLRPFAWYCLAAGLLSIVFFKTLS